VPLQLTPDSLCSYRCLLQCCRHLQCDEWDLEHCCSQRRSRFSCSHIAAESWARYIRRRPRCALSVLMSVIAGDSVWEWGEDVQVKFK